MKNIVDRLFEQAPPTVISTVTLYSYPGPQLLGLAIRFLPLDLLIFLYFISTDFTITLHALLLLPLLSLPPLIFLLSKLASFTSFSFSKPRLSFSLPFLPTFWLSSAETAVLFLFFFFYVSTWTSSYITTSSSICSFLFLFLLALILANTTLPLAPAFAFFLSIFFP